MELSDDQKKEISGWIEQGMGLSDIQAKIQEDFKINMTYMEVRFLVDDLDLLLKDAEPPAEKVVDENAPDAPPPPAQAAPSPHDELGGGSGGVSISINKVQRPGSVVSGDVTFASGNTAEWQIDQMGRLGIIPGADGYKPSEEDVMEFQQALQSELQKSGF